MVGPEGEKSSTSDREEALIEWFRTHVRTEGVATPRVWGEYMSRLAPLLPYTPTCEEILQGFVNIDMTADKLGGILKTNPYYGAQFIRLVDSMAKREITPSVEASVVLVGMANSRNFVLSLLLHRSVKNQHAEWTKEGKLKVQPSEILRACLKVEEALTEIKDPYSDLGFAAGLVWDTVAFAAQGFPGDQKKKAQPYADSLVDAAIQAGLIAQALGRGVSDFALGKYAFSTALLVPVGRVILAHLDAGFFPLMDLFAKKTMSPLLRENLERQKFGLDSSWLSAAVCENYPWFRPLVSALALYSSPWVAQKSDPKAAYSLAAVVRLAYAIQAEPACIEKPDDPRIAQWKGSILKDFKIDPASIIKATQRFKPSKG